MPEVYQGICGNCGHETAIMQGGYSAVWVDSPVSHPQNEFAGVALFGRNDQEGTLSDGDFAEIDDPRFVVLAHPVEDAILAETGYRWRDLLWQGRYVAVSNCSCRKCGTIFPWRQLAVPTAMGFGTVLVVGFVSAVVVTIWEHSCFAELVAAYVPAIVTAGIIWLASKCYYRYRFPQRVATLRMEQGCPKCGSKKRQKGSVRESLSSVRSVKRDRCSSIWWDSRKGWHHCL